MNTQHYEDLLAEVYDWMQGGWESRVEANRRHFAALGIGPAVDGARAIDIGAGTGYQSIPLAEFGYAVTAIDPSSAMLSHLATHVGHLPITTTTALIESYAGPPVDLVCCMGDTLTHLDSLDQIDRLLGRTHDALVPNGALILTYRDGSRQPQGDDRFLPIRSDHDRIFTCFLEQVDADHTRVHDILHTRTGDGFRQQVSSYIKLRLRPQVIDRALEVAGFAEITTSLERGLVTTVATKGGSPHHC